MPKSLFEKIVANEIPSWKVWEDASYIAFLTPFANTPGVTIVCPKKNPGDYIFDVESSVLARLMDAAKKVAKGLEQALDVKRVAVVFEGTGVPHIHAQLYPLHEELDDKTSVLPEHKEFYPKYLGYITTVEGPKMEDEKLDKLQQKIKEVLK